MVAKLHKPRFIFSCTMVAERSEARLAASKASVLLVRFTSGESPGMPLFYRRHATKLSG
jgi:hypothetical protein